MIKCVGDINLETLEFTGCRTVLRNVFDDCEAQPSTLCYNGIAYDTSYSETCGVGAQFRKIDSCGNPLDFGDCLELDTCEEVVVSPHTGTAITIHERCEVIDADEVKEQEEERKEKRKRTERQEPKVKDISVPDTEPDQQEIDTGVETVAPDDTQEETVEATEEPAPQTSPVKRIKQSQPTPFQIALIIAFILAIAIILYWLLRHH